jgi:hypothetical protein
MADNLMKLMLSSFHRSHTTEPLDNHPFLQLTFGGFQLDGPPTVVFRFNALDGTLAASLARYRIFSLTLASFLPANLPWAPPKSM